MSLVSNLSANESDLFLRVIGESLVVEEQFQLFLWLQGELQYFLPHEVLIVLVGDFSAGRLKFDIVSAMPGVKTVKCSGCQAQPVSGDLFNHWQRNGHQMISVEGKLPDFFNMACGCIADKRLSGVHSALMHGLRDERSGEDALYLLLRPEQPFTKRERRMFGLLLPQIDHACRRVVAGDGSQVCSDSPPGALPAVAADDSGLSGREMEIMSWVRAGKTNHEIGMILDISAFTVKNHLQRIFRKINVTNRAQAVSKFEGIGRPR